MCASVCVQSTKQSNINFPQPGELNFFFFKLYCRGRKHNSTKLSLIGALKLSDYIAYEKTTTSISTKSRLPRSSSQRLGGLITVTPQSSITYFLSFLWKPTSIFKMLNQHKTFLKQKHSNDAFKCCVNRVFHY